MVVRIVIVGYTIHKEVYPLYKAPDKGDGLLRRSATPAISSHHLPHILVIKAELPLRWMGSACYQTWNLPV